MFGQVGHRLASLAMVRCGWIAAVVSLVLTARSSRADVLVIDTCVAQCSDDDIAAIRAIRGRLRELNRPGLVSDARDVPAHLGDGTPLPAVSEPNLTSTQLVAEINRGIGMWKEGENQAAATLLETQLARCIANPGLVVSDPVLRNLVPRAIVARAVSLQRGPDAAPVKAEPAPPPRGKDRKKAPVVEAKPEVSPEELRARAEAAREVMEELVRISNATSILETNGPEADRIYQDARSALQARGRGTLVIHVDNPNVQLYIDEANEPFQSVFSSAMWAGTYRVFARDPYDHARRYQVTVRPGAQTTLAINWDQDNALEMVSPRQERVGFTYATDAERAHEADYVRRLGQHTHDASIIVVIGVRPVERHRMMYAALYSARSGEVMRAGVAPLTDVAEGSRQLAGFVTSAEATPLVRRYDEAPAVRSSAGSYDGIGAHPGYALTMIVATGLVVGGGVALVAVDNKAIGGSMLGVGAGVDVIALVAYSMRTPPPPRAAMRVAPTQGGAVATFQWRF